MREDVDPAEDRDEFVTRIDDIYDYCQLLSDREFRRAVISNDTAALQTLSDNLIAWEAEYTRVLSSYDAALDYDGRAAIVGAVETGSLPR